MLRREDWVDISAANQRGVAIKEICRKTGLARNTIRKAIRNELAPEFKSPPSKLDPYKEYLIFRLADYPSLSATKLLDEIKAKGYSGGFSILKKFTLPFRQSRKRTSNIRFETAPGSQAQVDWASLGYHTINGRRTKLSLFVMVLGFSRMMYAVITTDEKTETFLQCHRQAFTYFGGMTKEILYDKAKTVALKHDKDGVVFNRALLDFAYTCGFVPRVCHPGRPQTKGKVERAIRYVRDSFLEGECFFGLEDMQDRLLAWLDNVANTRLQQTIQARPIDLLLDEHLKLPRQAVALLKKAEIVPLGLSHSFAFADRLEVTKRDLSVYEAAVL